MTTGKQAPSYWVITIAAWALVVFAVVMAARGFITQDWVDGIGFALFAVIVVLGMHTPAWLQRFIDGR